MEPDTRGDRLSGITTLWTLVRRAHEGPADAVRTAQEELLRRYGGAVQRYLCGIVRNTEIADDLFQEFACRLVKGELHGADPQRGRFRQFVKGVLFHLVADHHRREKRRPAPLGDDLPELAVDPATLADMDREFVRSWREEVLTRCWRRLEEGERQNGKPFYTVLRFRVDNPQMGSAALAKHLGTLLKKSLTAAGVRQTLHRAREQFADLVLDEVVHSLDAPTPAQLEDELIELGLIDYCRPALERMRTD